MTRLQSTPTTVTLTDSPSWVPAPGQFASVSMATAASVDPCPSHKCAYSGTTGFESIWVAWNGGAYAPRLGTHGSMLFFGGGHFAYDGNQVVAYDIGSRNWSLLSEPGNYNTYTSGDSNTANVLVDVDGSFPDGTPYPNHTNMGCDHLPPEAGGGVLGSYVFVGHHQTGVNITNSNLWRFDLQARSWSSWRLPIRGSNLVSLTYDSKRRGLWWCTANRAESWGSLELWFLDVQRQVATRIGISSTAGKIGPIAYLPGVTYVESRDCIVLPRTGPELAVMCIDLNGLNVTAGAWAPMFEITQTGNRCRSLWTCPEGGAVGGNSYLNFATADQLEYCSGDGSLYALDLYSDGATLCRLEPPPAGALRTQPWAWTRETLAPRSGEPLALRTVPYSITDDRRLFGKMRYVPSIRSFVLSDSSQLPVQALRPRAFA